MHIVGRVTNKRLVHMNFVLSIREAQEPNERRSLEKSVDLIVCKCNTEAWQQFLQNAFLIVFLETLGLSGVCFRVRVDLDM